MCDNCFFCVLFVYCVPSVLWYCWLGLLTCKNHLPYNLYCVGGDIKPCSINQSINQVKNLLVAVVNTVKPPEHFPVSYIRLSFDNCDSRSREPNKQQFSKDWNDSLRADCKNATHISTQLYRHNCWVAFLQSTLKSRHGSITFWPITIKLQLNNISAITITTNYCKANYNYNLIDFNYNYNYVYFI